MSFEPLVHLLLSPLVVALLLGGCAGALALVRWRRLATGIAAFALVGLWVCSTPWLAYALNDALVARYPALAPADAPAADAILLLGGAVAGAQPPLRPTLQLGMSSTRVWYAAALYRARKAPRIVVAAGNRTELASAQVEAEAIADVLKQLGVPAEALVLERQSRSTRENAANVLPILQAMDAQRVLLVTSADHMPRAVATFAKIWAEKGPKVLTAPTPAAFAAPGNGWELWFPSLPALLVVTASLKEFAGTAGLAIIR